MRVFFQTVALLSKNRTCARPRCNATPSEHCLHSSHCPSHPALHTSHLHFISTHLIRALLISFHMSGKFFLIIVTSSEHSSTFLISPKLVSTHLGSSARQQAWDTDAFPQKSLYKILCTTKLAQSTSQYYFVLQSLHRVHPVALCTTRLEENIRLKHFEKDILHGKSPALKLKKIYGHPRTNHYRRCSSSNTIDDVQLQKTMVLRMQPRHQATWTQPSPSDLQMAHAHGNITWQTRMYQCIYARANTRWQHSCSHSNAICSQTFKKRCSQTFKKRKELCTWTTTRCRTPRENRLRVETSAPATAAHANTRYLSSPAAATSHGKTQRFVLRLPPQNTPRATWMQPLQYVSQHHVSNPHVSTDMATKHDSNHAANFPGLHLSPSPLPYHFRTSPLPVP